MSPEQINEQYYDYKIDVGIACVLYFLLFKKYPLKGNINQLKYNIRNKFPGNNIFYNSNISENLNKIKKIMKEMFEKNKHKRMNLSLFMEKSYKLLDFYKINYENTQFKQYSFQSVPNTINDWNNLIKKLHIDFEFNTNKIINKIQATVKLPDKKPVIKTFSEIKNKPPVPLYVPLPKIQKYNKNDFNLDKPCFKKKKYNVNMPEIRLRSKQKSDIDLLYRINVEKRIRERKNRILLRKDNDLQKKNFNLKCNIMENNNYLPKSSLHLLRSKLKPLTE